MNVGVQILVYMDPLYQALLRVQWIWARLLLLDTKFALVARLFRLFWILRRTFVSRQ